MPERRATNTFSFAIMVRADTKDGGILLIKEPNKNGKWSFPGGIAQSGEKNPRSTIIRILDEQFCDLHRGEPLFLCHNELIPPTTRINLDSDFYDISAFLVRTKNELIPRPSRVIEVRWFFDLLNSPDEFDRSPETIEAILAVVLFQKGHLQPQSRIHD